MSTDRADTFLLQARTAWGYAEKKSSFMPLVSVPARSLVILGLGYLP